MTERANFRIASRGEVEEPTAVCAICLHEGVPQPDAHYPIDTILSHLAGAHGLDIEIETWPDGDPVIVDSTLQPGDFSGDADA